MAKPKAKAPPAPTDDEIALARLTLETDGLLGGWDDSGLDPVDAMDPLADAVADALGDTADPDADPLAEPTREVLHPDGGRPEAIHVPPGTLEEQTTAELSELLQRMNAASGSSSDRWADLVDTWYYGVVIFQSHDQRAEFLAGIHCTDLVVDGHFIDGLKMAARLGVPITSPTPKPQTLHADAKLSALAGGTAAPKKKRKSS